MPRGRQSVDLRGNKYGRLTVLDEAERSQSGNIRWLCQCECGKTAIVHGSSLRSGRTKSCGCYQREQTGNATRIHGETRSRLHIEWSSMRSRCNNQKNKRYDRYGGRGITVCPEWDHSYVAFRDWAIANGYRDNLTIDRIDNDGNYEPQNCRWTTQKEQQNNKSTTVKIEYHGETLSIKGLAEKYDIDYHCLYARLQRGWSIEQALTKPSRKRINAESTMN